MIQTLEGLKVEAIAVDCAEQYDTYYIRNSSILILGLEHLSTWKREIELPPGEWTILGRANELRSNDGYFLDSFFKLVGRKSDEKAKEFWINYREVNNLTNQLILIKQ